MTQKSAVLEPLLSGPSTKDAERGTAPGASKHDMQTVNAPVSKVASVSMSRHTESGFHAKRHFGCKVPSSSLPVWQNVTAKCAAMFFVYGSRTLQKLPLFNFQISN